MSRTWRRPALSAVLLAALVVASPAPARAGTVAVSVPNGITTADLASVGMTKEALASALVGSNPGISIKAGSVTSVGQTFQLGTVHVVDPTVVSFNDGVILSSGDIANIVGPNKSDSITGVGAGNEDAQLTALISNTQTVNPMTYDAAALEFDFTPTTSTVYFTYVFGSDEYLEWVNLFNDVFGFFVTDNSGSTTNCAMTPTTQTVSIDTINDAVNPTLYRDNSFASPPANPLNIEADGLSVELICHAAVTPNALNHMKIAIADTSDQVLDSWVMLKSGSLSTIQPESCNDGIDDDSDAAVDMEDTDCSGTTAPAPTGAGGVGVNNAPPAFTGSAGQPVVLDASIFNVDLSALDPIETPDNVVWSLVGINGNTGTCTLAETQPMDVVGIDVPTTTAACTQPGEYRATLDALFGTDSKGDWDIDFFVQDAPPTVDLTAPQTGDSFASGAPVSVSMDISGLTDGESVTCSVDWGAGAPAAGDVSAGVCTASKVYATDGQYVVSVTATDSAGNAAAKAAVVSVGKASQAITVTSPVPTTAEVDSTFTISATKGASTSPLVFAAAGACTQVDGTYTVTSPSGVCTVTLSQAGDATYFAATTLTYYVAATGLPQTIDVTVEPPGSARYASSFTVEATGGDSAAALVFGASGGCSVAGAVYTMTSSTESCIVTVDQPAAGKYAAADQVGYEVTAELGQQTRVSLKASLAKGKTLTIPKATAQGGALTVTVSGSCTLVRKYTGTGARKKLRNFSLKGTRAGKCTVKVKAAAVPNYKALAKYTLTVKVK